MWILIVSFSSNSASFPKPTAGGRRSPVRRSASKRTTTRWRDWLTAASMPFLLCCSLLAALAKEECADSSSPAVGQLAGKLAVITGASRGVGAELARVYAREGAFVVVNYFSSKEKGEAVAAEINAAWPSRALAAQGDVTVKEDMVKLVADAETHFGRKVSVVVNNALPRYKFDPGSSMASIKTVSTEDLEQQMRGTLAGAVNMVQAALPSFEASKFGKVVNIGSNLVDSPRWLYRSVCPGEH